MRRAIHGFGRLLDSAEHAAEDEFVQRHDGVPIEEARQASGPKAGRHDQPGQGRACTRVDLLDGEVELGLAWQLHLRPQGKRPVAVDAHHPPEVECFTELHHLRVPSPAPQPRPAHELVEPATQPPEHVAGIPAIAASDSADRRVDARRIGFDIDDPLVGEDGAARPGWISGDLDLRPMDRLANAQSLVRHQPLGRVVGDDHAVLEPLRQRAGDPVGNRGHEVDPQRTQPRRQHGHRQDDPAAKAELFGHDPHQLPVGHHIGSADLQRLAGGRRHLEAADQPVQHVGNGHRLALGGDPSGRHHDRESLDQIAEDLKRRRAGADDHRRPKGGHRHSAGGEDLLDLPP